jgi:hypothetical protein
VGGCLLRACEKLDTMDGNAKQTPAVHVKTLLQKKEFKSNLFLF